MSDDYIDSSIPEIEDRESVSNPGVKLPPNQYPWYEQIRGESCPKQAPEKPKEPRRIDYEIRDNSSLFLASSLMSSDRLMARATTPAYRQAGLKPR
jgi:hypothetical protein